MSLIYQHHQKPACRRNSENEDSRVKVRLQKKNAIIGDLSTTVLRRTRRSFRRADGTAKKKTRARDFFSPLLSFSTLSPAYAEDCEEKQLSD